MQLKVTLLDPAVNRLFKKMREKVGRFIPNHTDSDAQSQAIQSEKELQKAREELQANTFTYERWVTGHKSFMAEVCIWRSLNGKRLMSKCKTLQEENADFASQAPQLHAMWHSWGWMPQVSEGRLKMLELEIKLKKSHIDKLTSALQGNILLYVGSQSHALRTEW